MRAVLLYADSHQICAYGIFLVLQLFQKLLVQLYSPLTFF
jgi:hypothetical protein